MTRAVLLLGFYGWLLYALWALAFPRPGMESEAHCQQLERLGLIWTGGESQETLALLAHSEDSPIRISDGCYTF
jgi:hypothetical protein